MLQAIRPYFTSGIVLVGASALVIAPISVPPPEFTAPTISISTADVMPASLVTDLLNAFNTVSVAGGDSAQILLNTVGLLPRGLAAALSAAAQDPALIPSIASALANGFLNPGLPSSLPTQFSSIVVSLASLLPPPLGPGPAITDPGLVLTLFGALGQVLGQTLALLPSPVLGGLAIYNANMHLPTFLTDFTTSFNTILSGLAAGIGGTPLTGPGLAGFIGQSPAVLLATLQASLSNPGDIPNYLSYLAYSVLNPAGLSLFTTTLGPIIGALIVSLPAPIGGVPDGLVYNLSTKIGAALTTLLGILPAPSNPALAPTMLVAKTGPEIELAAASIGVPDADLGDVVASVQTAFGGIVKQAEALPAGVQAAVQIILKDPTLLPAVVVGFVNGGIDGLERALGGVATTVIRTLPQALRAPALEAFQGVGGIIQGAQDAATALAKPPTKVAVKSEVSLVSEKKPAEEKSESDPADVPKPHRSLVQLNAPGGNTPNLFGGNTIGESANPLGGLGSHHLGAGKTPVKDLINKVLGVKDVKDVKDAPAAAAG